ncbi:hypothetical protein F0562_033658 [Nyssa sinensis]|uniref:Uncharacterized protein n=1 Tax=Nyssa sinensis TaxID=561372 RepID=A0A5J5AF02_9ASTE|nr:hypothetical protein F0562_033658 [Nyssa sinensis]
MMYFNSSLKLSTRPEKYLGDLATWEKAEADLTEALNEFGKPWQINEGDVCNITAGLPTSCPFQLVLLCRG